MCTTVSPPPPPPVMRSEPLVRHLLLEKTTILKLSYLCLCLITLFMLNINLKCRYLSFDTRLNTLPGSTKVNRTEKLLFSVFFSVYLLIFEYYFVVFLPLDTRRIRKKVIALVRKFHSLNANIALGACYRLFQFGYKTLVCFCHYPLEIFAIWICILHLTLCPDIHPNPGPTHSNQFVAGFLSFCNFFFFLFKRIITTIRTK